MFRRPLSSPSVLLLSAIPNASLARTLLAWAVDSKPRLLSDPARDRRPIRFLGSLPVRACSLPVRLRPLHHVNDYFPKAVRGTPLHQLVTATTLYGYIEQGPSTISMTNPGDNGAPVDPVNRPAFGYTLNLLCFCLLFKFYLSFNLNTCTCFAVTGSLITVMNLLIISGIKMCRKLPIYLTQPTWSHIGGTSKRQIKGGINGGEHQH
jgi:hypothetical protein